MDIFDPAVASAVLAKGYTDVIAPLSEHDARAERLQQVATLDALYLAAFYNQLRETAVGMPADTAIDLTTRWWHQKLWGQATTKRDESAGAA